MFGPGGTKFKKSKSKQHSDRRSCSGGSINGSKATPITNFMISAADRDDRDHQAAKSDHGDKKFGFFENFRRKVVGLGR